jgi:hypothetical protein
MAEVAIDYGYSAVEFGWYEGGGSYCKLIVSGEFISSRSSQFLEESTYIVFDGSGVILMKPADFVSTYMPIESHQD